MGGYTVCDVCNERAINGQFHNCQGKKINMETSISQAAHDMLAAEEEEWKLAEKRMEAVAQNGNTGEHYDMVNHPPHYQSDNGIECIDAIRAALGKDGFIAYCRGNAIKYAWRDKLDNAEDHKKAAWYMNRAAEEESDTFNITRKEG